MKDNNTFLIQHVSSFNKVVELNSIVSIQELKQDVALTSKTKPVSAIIRTAAIMNLHYVSKCE